MSGELTSALSGPLTRAPPAHSSQRIALALFRFALLGVSFVIALLDRGHHVPALPEPLSFRRLASYGGQTSAGRDGSYSSRVIRKTMRSARTRSQLQRSPPWRCWMAIWFTKPSDVQHRTSG